MKDSLLILLGGTSARSALEAMQLPTRLPCFAMHARPDAGLTALARRSAPCVRPARLRIISTLTNVTYGKLILLAA